MFLVGLSVVFGGGSLRLAPAVACNDCRDIERPSSYNALQLPPFLVYRILLFKVTVHCATTLARLNRLHSLLLQRLHHLHVFALCVLV